MKFLFISEFFPATFAFDIRGGIEARTFKIASFLARKHEVFILASSESGKPRSQVLGKVHIFRVGLSLNYIRSGNVLGRVIFIFAAVIHGLFIDFDLIEGSSFFGWLPAFVLGTIKNKKKVIIVADIISEYAAETGIYFHPLRWIESFFLRRNWDCILCISNTVKTKITPRVRKNQFCTTIYCGCDFDLIRKISVKKNHFPRLICVSRLVHYKRVTDLIEALLVVGKLYPKVKLDIIGSGDNLERIKKIALGRGVFNQILFHGYMRSHRDVLRLIKKAHIFCLPSVVEGFGIATVESLAAAVPAVIADIPVNKEITHKKGAIFFKKKNYFDLAAKIISLLNNRTLYKKLSKEGSVLSRNYKWSVIAQQTLELYENLRTHR